MRDVLVCWFLYLPRCTHFPFLAMPVSMLPSSARNKPGHMKRTYTCQAQKHSALRNDRIKSGQCPLDRMSVVVALWCHASRSLRWLRMTLASGYAPMSSAAKTDPAASVTATECPISGSKSSAVKVLLPSRGPNHLWSRSARGRPMTSQVEKRSEGVFCFFHFLRQSLTHCGQ